MYGALIVEDQVSPDVDHDITAIIDDWRLQQDGQFVDDFSNQHDMGHEGRLGNFARAIFTHKTVQQGDRIRLRLINAATARVFPLRLDGLKGKVVALDGMALDAPSKLSQVTLAPAQRVDVIADVVDVPQIVFSSRQGDYFLGEIAVDGYNSTRQPSKIGALPQPNLSKPDLNTPHRLTLDMQGGAMGGRHYGTDIWAFNDVSGLPPKPFAVFRSGETAKISLVNSTAFPHGIHLHGQHFFELDDDGLLGVFRDTTLVDAGQSRDIACVFDNPGRWLLHCHMLGHQAAGMRTWIEVV